jgi:hypothetical protein
MNKIKAIVVAILLSSALILLFLNGIIRVISILLSYPNYVIVVADEYYDNPKLQEFVSWKRNQGYVIEVKKVSEILSSYPVSILSVSFLKVQNFTDIQSKYVRVYALWYDASTKRYRISAFHGIGTTSDGKREFAVVDPPSRPEYVYLYIQGKGSGAISLVFDGGKSLTVNVPNYPYDYTYWGKPLVTVDGNIYFNETSAYSILKYVKSNPSLEYLLLIGNVSRVPAFDLREIDVSTNTIFTGVTDHPYAVVNPEEDWNMIPKVSVGRIPCDNSRELEIALDKAMEFTPFMSKKALFFKGASGGVDQSTWDEIYTRFRDYVNQTLHYIYPGVYTYELIEPSKSDFLSNVNSENCYLLGLCHGGIDIMYLSPSYTLTVSDVYSYVSFKNSTVLVPISCYVNDYSKVLMNKCIGESFLFDPDSNIAVFVGSTLPVEADGARCLIEYFFYYVYSEKTIGMSLLKAKLTSFTIDYFLILQRLEWNTLGDPAINLLVPMSQPPPAEYGWLDLGYTVNGQSPTENTEFKVVYPNGTIKVYYMTRGTINNCPVGNYVINCTYHDQTKSTTTYVQANTGTTVIFDFQIVQPPPSQEVGTIRVYSNVEVAVNVTGPISTVKVTPFVLSNIPVGTYTLTAKYGDVVLTKTIELHSGEDTSYTFEFEISPPSSNNIFSLIIQYLPYILIGLAVIALIKR